MSKREDKELKKLIKEKEKLEDKMARDEMVKRMLEKDAKTKGSAVVENPQGKELTLEERLKYIPELRKVSRQKYLELREDQQLDLFKRKLDDEERLFSDQNLTEQERHLHDLNKKLYELANKRREKNQKAQVYRMPDAYEDEDGHRVKDKSLAAGLKRYEEEKKELTEQEEWEMH